MALNETSWNAFVGSKPRSAWRSSSPSSAACGSVSSRCTSSTHWCCPPARRTYVVNSWCPSSVCSVPRALDAFFFWLGYSNSSINPILYTIFNDDFRRAFRSLLGCGADAVQGSRADRRGGRDVSTVRTGRL